MGKEAIIYHNPRCSKSRQALQLLRDHGVEPTIVDHLKDPPSASRVRQLLKLLGVPPHALLRSKEAPYKAHGLSKDSSAAAVSKAIVADPILLERPLVVRGNKTVIGRPPENVLELL
jgi:arsenate reductase (glutaredoxin)